MKTKEKLTLDQLRSGSVFKFTKDINYASYNLPTEICILLAHVNKPDESAAVSHHLVISVPKLGKCFNAGGYETLGVELIHGEYVSKIPVQIIGNLSETIMEILEMV